MSPWERLQITQTVEEVATKFQLFSREFREEREGWTLDVPKNLTASFVNAP